MTKPLSCGDIIQPQYKGFGINQIGDVINIIKFKWHFPKA